MSRSRTLSIDLLSNRSNNQLIDPSIGRSIDGSNNQSNDRMIERLIENGAKLKQLNLIQTARPPRTSRFESNSKSYANNSLFKGPHTFLGYTFLLSASFEAFSNRFRTVLGSFSDRLELFSNRFAGFW